tara:strand:- start:23776 stop:24432 length:657 start_codon:yes stop_codon:yes gene_type:complete
MKLYGVYLSPFATSVMMFFEAKGVKYELAFPVGGLGSEEFGKINYMQRIPVLETDDGDYVYESTVITQFIDDMHPMPSVVGKSPLEAAHNRTLARLADIYLLHGFLPVTAELAERRFDSDVVKLCVKTALRGLKDIDETMRRTGFKAQKSFTLADCFLVPALTVVDVVMSALRQGDYLESVPEVAAYWRDVQTLERHHHYVSKMREAFALRRETGEAM